MKLSQMNGDQLMNCLCVIAEPTEEIISDEKFFPALISCLKTNEKKVSFNAVRFAFTLLPMLFNDHRDAFLKIIGALNSKSVEELKNQNGLVLIKDLQSCFDKEMLHFFGLFSSGE